MSSLLGTEPGKYQAEPHHFQHRHLRTVHHPGIFPGRRGVVLYGLNALSGNMILWRTESSLKIPTALS